MKNLTKYIMIGSLLMLLYGCEDELDINPKGVLTESQLQEPEQLDDDRTQVKLLRRQQREAI